MSTDANSYLNHVLEVSASHFEELKEVVRSGVDIVPFVGAGFSAPYRYPMWGQFLSYVLDALRSKSPRKSAVTRVPDLLKKGKFEEAADLLHSSDPLLFEDQIQVRFGPGAMRRAEDHDSITHELVAASGRHVLTTNFDTCLETVFSKHRRPFSKVVTPRELAKDLGKLHTGNPVLIKLHGSHDDDKTRILTKQQYYEHYATQLSTKKPLILDLNKPLPLLLQSLAANRIFLFIGCSLNIDTTLEVLRELNKRMQGDYHFAILPLPKSNLAKYVDAKTSFLRKAGIKPIWYEAGQHQRIKAYISSLAEIRSNTPEFTARELEYHIPARAAVMRKIDRCLPLGVPLRVGLTVQEYRHLALDMIRCGGHLSTLIWTMNGSPLDVPEALWVKGHKLTRYDLQFSYVAASTKHRIIIFKGEKDIRRYINALGGKRSPIKKRRRDYERVIEFQNSITRGGNTHRLYFASKHSLKQFGIRQYRDIGYIAAHSMADARGLFFCSSFTSKDRAVEKDGPSRRDVVMTMTAANLAFSDDCHRGKKPDIVSARKLIDSILLQSHVDDLAGIFDDAKELLKFEVSRR